MAAILESVTVPRSSSFRTTLSAPTMASSVCSLSSNCNVSPLREFKGLRIQSRSPKLALSSVSLKSARIARRRGGVVVCEAQETTLEVASVTDATWKSLVLDSDLPVLVDFWAPWCGPCRMIHPMIDELAKQYAGKLRCYKLNTDDSPLTATQYGIRSIPTVMIFKNGEKKDSVIGAVPKSTLTASIDKFV